MDQGPNYLTLSIASQESEAICGTPFRQWQRRNIVAYVEPASSIEDLSNIAHVSPPSSQRGCRRRISVHRKACNRENPVEDEVPRLAPKPRIEDVHHVDWAKDVIYDIDSDKDNRRGSDAAPEWTLPTAMLDKDTLTELLVVKSIELRVTRSGRERVVLVCPSEPPSSSSTTSHPEKPEPEMRWL